MPSTGRPTPRTSGSSDGASGSYTDAGPPERIKPAGRLAMRFATATSCGTISEYTRHSRTRRAMSCAYCAPRSMTRTGRGSCSAVIRSMPHPHVLSLLIRLALGLDGWGHDQLGLLELPDRGVPRGRHRRGEPAEQVQRAVVLVRRTHEDLGERGDLLGLDPRTARKRWVERSHPPVVAPTGSLVGARERRADHHRVGAAGDSLGDVTTGPHATVRDDVAVPAGLSLVFRAGRRRVGDGRGLGDANSDDAPGGTGVARTHSHQYTRRAGPHEVERGLVRRAAADDHGEVEPCNELLQVERLRPGGHVFRRD